MKRLVGLAIISLVLNYHAAGQSRYSASVGQVNFTSNAALELIKASTSTMRGVVDPSTGQFAFVVPISSFKGFNSELQRQHFNDKYMESDRFPNATFSGKIIDDVDFGRDGSYPVRVKGELEIHGQKQTRIIRGTIVVKGNNLTVDASFIVPLSDHNIAIPNIVSQKIATEIDIIVHSTLQPES